MELNNSIKGVIKFSKELSHKNVAALLTEVEAKLAVFQEIIIYWTCTGGAIADARVLTDYLNLYCARIELVGAWTLASSGFDVMLFFEGKRRLVGSAYAVVHIGANTYCSRELKQPNSPESFYYKTLERENDKYLVELKKILTATEFRKVKNGGDVYIPMPRLAKILNCETDCGF